MRERAGCAAEVRGGGGLTLIVHRRDAEDAEVFGESYRKYLSDEE